MSVALHALHTQQWADDEPAPPSPTLTNPDNILPTVDRDYTALSAPRAGFARRTRPPSPSYLRERSRPASPAGEHAANRDMARKEHEKPGLMSRKMLLLRSRTGGNAINSNLRDARRARNVSHGSIDSDYTSPVLQDVGNLAPEQPAQQAEQLQLPDKEKRRKSGSSSGLSGMAEFLAKYAKPEGTGSDDETVDENAPQFESSEVDAQRRKQEIEEYNSAILSKRAEQILANAKKRLNVMEGNLRGARDLVAPLTTANLKRATSLGSAHAHYLQGSASYNSRVRYIPQEQHYDLYDRDRDGDQDPTMTLRTLHSQTSTPALGRQYQHTRNFSTVNLPERPFTSLDQRRSGSGLQSRSRTPSRTRFTESPTQTSRLRGSRSSDSLKLGSHERPLHNRVSPDANHLEALPEGDDESTWRDTARQRYHHQTSGSQDTNNGLGIHRPASRSDSRTSDLREQMSSLKGRISTLKDRAREDSLRRQSQASLRATQTTPFNNAESAAPELFYSPGVNDARELKTPEVQDGGTADSWAVSGSRNAFAEQAGGTKKDRIHKDRIQYGKAVEVVTGSNPERKARVRNIRINNSPNQENGHKRSETADETSHRRTSSASAMRKSAEKRHSYHQPNSSKTAMPGTCLDDRGVEDMLAGPPSPPLSDDGFGSSPVLPRSSQNYIVKTDSSIDDDYAPSESDAGDSVYEDAVEYEGEGVVPHEHREDAFDYENFFLSGAMARYNVKRRPSESSAGSMSSTATARGPAAAKMDESDNDNDNDVDGYVSDPGVGGIFPPDTPQTPERLRAIERTLAERQLAARPLSEESVSTMHSFSTAKEGSDSPGKASHLNGAYSRPVSPISVSLGRISTLLNLPDRAISPMSDAGRDAFRGPTEGGRNSKHAGANESHSLWTNRTESLTLDTNPRPRTAVRLRRSSSSDRADSGIGSETKSTPNKPSPSPLTHRHGQPSRDLTSVAVNTLLDPTGVALGLRENAVLFGVVESLRHVVREMQRKEEEGDEKDGMSREMRMLMMRRRLERARGALDGGFGGA